MYHCCHSNFISADVQKCPCSYGTDRCESDLCRKDTRHVRYRNLLESSDPDRRTWNRIRNDSYICQSTRRIWSYFHACRKYPGKDRNNLAEDRNGHSGRRLYDSGRVGCDCHGDCIPGDLPDESDLGKKMKNVKRW